MLTVKQKKLNDFIIREAGLELDDSNHVIDQDTGMPIIIRDKIVKYNNGSIYRLNSNETEFDPLNNTLLTAEICNNYLNKLENEGEIHITSFGLSNSERNTLGKAICIGDDRYTTREYILDSLKYIDLIATINDTPVDDRKTINLKSYDQKPRKTTTRRK